MSWSLNAQKGKFRDEGPDRRYIKCKVTKVGPSSVVREAERWPTSLSVVSEGKRAGEGAGGVRVVRGLANHGEEITFIPSSVASPRRQQIQCLGSENHTIWSILLKKST